MVPQAPRIKKTPAATRTRETTPVRTIKTRYRRSCKVQAKIHIIPDKNTGRQVLSVRDVEAVTSAMVFPSQSNVILNDGIDVNEMKVYIAYVASLFLVHVVLQTGRFARFTTFLPRAPPDSF